jgi:hypothetical protein
MESTPGAVLAAQWYPAVIQHCDTGADVRGVARDTAQALGHLKAPRQSAGELVA